MWPTISTALAGITSLLLIAGCGVTGTTTVSLTEIKDSLLDPGLTVCSVKEKQYDTPGDETTYSIKVALGDCQPSEESADEETAQIRVTKFDTDDARKEAARQAEIVSAKPYWKRLVWDIGPYMIALSNNPRTEKEIKNKFTDAMKKLDDEVKSRQ